MAHADYHCCAVCDSKLSYSNDADTKETICGTCLKNMRGLGLNILDVGELMDYINDCDFEILRSNLKKLDFRFCYYSNLVDSALKERGIGIEEGSRLVK